MDGYISKRAAHRLIDNREYDLSNPIQKDLFHNAVNNLPSADAQHWIPCSEGLPEEDGEYLVTDVSGGAATVTETYFITDCEDEGHWGALDVIAWMPMPEPYKDGEHNG